MAEQDALVDELRRNTRVLEENNKRANIRYKSDSRMLRELNSGFRSVSRLAKLAGSLVIGINVLKKALTFSDKTIQTSIKTNIDLNKSFRGWTQRFESSVGGWTEALDLVTESLDSGVRNISEGLVRLGLDMRHTGQSTKGLNQLMANMEGVLGLTVEGQETLTTALSQVSDKYQISTDKLIIALGETVQALSPLALTGGAGGNTAKAIASLAASMGPGGSQLAGSFIQEIMSIGSDASRRAQAGAIFQPIEALIRSMEQGARPETQLALMNQLIRRGGPKFFNDLRDVGLQKSAFGTDIGIQSAIMRQAQLNASKFEKREGTKFDPNATISGMLANLLSIIRGPAFDFLQLITQPLGTTLNQIQERISNFYESSIKPGIQKWIDDVKPDFDDLLLYLKKISEGIDSLVGIKNTVKGLPGKTLDFILNPAGPYDPSFGQARHDKWQQDLFTAEHGSFSDNILDAIKSQKNKKDNSYEEQIKRVIELLESQESLQKGGNDSLQSIQGKLKINKPGEVIDLLGRRDG